MSELLSRLDAVISERLGHSDPTTSYVASLHRGGLDSILKKVAEESGETLIAAKNAAQSGANGQLVHETADLWFHCMVMLAELGLSSADVLAELERRFDLSGLTEKAARSMAPDVD
jgi:phosphoribosyl-ATP pyrophosphohydrolase